MSESQLEISKQIGPRELLSIPDFRLLWSGQAVSNFGDALTHLTLELAQTAGMIIGATLITMLAARFRSTKIVSATLMALGLAAALVGLRNVFLISGGIIFIAGLASAWIFRDYQATGAESGQADPALPPADSQSVPPLAEMS
jgi:hypothetical protein